MLLSEAIRIGSMLRPQVRGGLYSVRNVSMFGDVLGLRRERVASCALGAAYEAIGSRSRTITADGVTQLFRGEPAAAGAEVEAMVTPWEWRVLFMTAACPVCEHPDQLFRAIPHLNDDHGWSREQIADFVATVELLQSADAVDPVVPK